MYYLLLTVPMALAIALTAILVWPWLRQRRSGKGAFQPAKRPRATSVLRRTEAFAVLGLGSGLALAWTADWSRSLSIGPFLISLISLWAVVFIAHFLALFGRPRLAVAVLVLYLTAGLFAIDAFTQPVRPGSPSSPREPEVVLQKFVISPSVEGAELWVNGVLLGEPPLTIPKEDFLAKVPNWEQPPEDFDLELARYNAHELEIADKYRKLELESRRVPWFEFVFNADGNWVPRSERKGLYYARIRLGDEWGVGHGSGSSALDKDVANWTYIVNFHVEFRAYNALLDQLIDQARLLGSEVGPAWFRAMETHGSRGGEVFYWSMRDDPSLKLVNDAWARWRYGFDKTSGPDAAWEALERICDKADRLEEYRPRCVADRAVELLVPLLDPERLAGETVRRLAENRSRGPGSPYPFVLVHAAKEMDRFLDQREGEEPNVIERMIPPELLRRLAFSPECPSMKLAMEIGGPVIEQFILRQDWQSDEEGSDWEVKFKRKVNRWLYFAMMLDTPGGDRFRREHEKEVFDAAEQILSGYFQLSDIEDIDFIFLDKERGRDSLAMKFWPRFQEILDDPNQLRSDVYFAYLVQMEPYAADEMYLESWRKSATWDSSCAYALAILDDLPEGRLRSVLKTILADVESNPDYYIQNAGGRLEQDNIEHWIGMLQLRIKRLTKGEEEREYIQSWVKHGALHDRPEVFVEKLAEKPDSVLVEVAARHENPEVRLITKRALTEHPSQRNQELVEELLTDPDERVRTVAQEVKRSYTELVETPSSEFAHPLARGGE